ncbi:hypothetical protein [Moorena bouillonii]|uniref:hypothetical protein n=1 Tax=Moorena bouillonii TaxID=207920 RepID=UPI000A42E9DD|nr:hypothetical protein [Moorena bouillonii]
MGKWGNGEMGKWGDGEMGRWGDGLGIEQVNMLLFCPSLQDKLDESQKWGTQITSQHANMISVFSR